MRAVVLDTDDRFRLVETDEPRPGPGEVAVRVAYAGVQWGDVLLRGGHFPLPRPFAAGFEAAGRIVAVGAGIDAGRVGQPVTALASGGAYAEVVVVPAALVLPAEGIEPRTAGGFGWGTPTAYDLINTVGRVRAGDRVLVHGASGGVGTLAVQFAALAGAAEVVGVVGSDERATYAAGFGLDRAVLRDEFPAALDGERFDVILDPVGGVAREANLRLLAPHGRLAVYGNIATFDPVPAEINDLLAEGTSVLTYNSTLLSRTHPDRLAESAAAALRLVAEGRVRIDITGEYELADTDTAVRRLAEGATHGKTVVRVA